jgi:hypothetical protein
LRASTFVGQACSLSGPTEGRDGARTSEDKVQAGDEGRWLFPAELAARERGNLSLGEALDLVVLYAEAEPAKYEKAALWLARYVSEAPPSLLRAQIALAALSDYGEAARPPRSAGRASPGGNVERGGPAACGNLSRREAFSARALLCFSAARKDWKFDLSAPTSPLSCETQRVNLAFTVTRKLVIAALTTGLFVFVLTPVSSAGQTSVWKRYTSLRYGYSLAHPPKWQIVRATTSTLTESFPTEPQDAVDKFLSCGDDCPTGIAVAVYARKLRAGTTLKRFATDEAAALADNYGCLKKTTVASSLGGESAVVLSYPSCLGNYLVEYAVVHKGRGFDIYLLAPPGHSARDGRTFRSILKTFRFTH